jgi:cell shape-determining protein MreD
MKKIKQILALIGAILLACLYLATLVFAITDNSKTMNVFFASVVATVLIPVLIWAYTLIYRLVKKSDEQEDSSAPGND